MSILIFSDKRHAIKFSMSGDILTFIIYFKIVSSCSKLTEEIVKFSTPELNFFFYVKVQAHKCIKLSAAPDVLK